MWFLVSPLAEPLYRAAPGFTIEVGESRGKEEGTGPIHNSALLSTSLILSGIDSSIHAYFAKPLPCKYSGEAIFTVYDIGILITLWLRLGVEEKDEDRMGHLTLIKYLHDAPLIFSIYQS